MNKNLYIKTVIKKLYLPQKIKNDILEQLELSFQNSYMNGESDNDIIKRLGTPQEFIEDTLESMELSEIRHLYAQKNKIYQVLIILFLIIAILFTIFVFYQSVFYSNVIGFSNGPSGILIFDQNFTNIFICILFWLIPLTLYLIKKRI